MAVGLIAVEIYTVTDTSTPTLSFEDNNLILFNGLTTPIIFKRESV